MMAEMLAGIAPVLTQRKSRFILVSLAAGLTMSRLQELARALADKVRATGRSQSTRPLSAYQRRVIHLTLQDDPDVQTRSSGEGPLKRVIIQRRRQERH